MTKSPGSASSMPPATLAGTSYISANLTPRAGTFACASRPRAAAQRHGRAGGVRLGRGRSTLVGVSVLGLPVMVPVTVVAVTVVVLVAAVVVPVMCLVVLVPRLVS